jgi:hypothetical protein
MKVLARDTVSHLLVKSISTTLDQKLMKSLALLLLVSVSRLIETFDYIYFCHCS